MWRSQALGQQLLPIGPASLGALEADFPGRAAAAAAGDLSTQCLCGDQKEVGFWGGFYQMLSAPYVQGAVIMHHDNLEGGICRPHYTDEETASVKGKCLVQSLRSKLVSG